MGWFDILKKLTRDEMGQVRPYIRDELREAGIVEEYEDAKTYYNAYYKLRGRLKRPPTNEELQEELSNPTPRRRAVRPTKYRKRNTNSRKKVRQPKPKPKPKPKPEPEPEPEPVPEPNQERFPLFHNIKLYLESQNIYPSVMNILAELKDSDKVNPEQDVIDIGEYLRTQNLE